METATLVYEFYNGSTWVDISADVLATPAPKWSRGLGSDSPSSLVAASGSLTFFLNNSAFSIGGVAGYYSPDNSNAVAGFDLGANVRVKSTYSATDRYQFYGRISSITPTMGRYRDRKTEVVVRDYMHELEERNVDILALQTSKRSDELLTTLIAAMDVAPLATSYDNGVGAYTLSFFDLQGEKQTAISVVQRIVQGDMSRVWVVGDATGGETLKLVNRHDDIGKTSSLTLNDTMEGMTISRKRSGITNNAIVTMQTPIPGTANEVIYTLPIEKTISAGQSWTFTAQHRDPDGGARITASNVVSPSASTDFSFSSVSGSGEDFNAYLSVAISKGADRTELTLTNTHPTRTGYLWFFQLRGIVLRLRDPIEIATTDATSITAYGEKTLRYSGSYQSNENTAKSISEFIIYKYKDPRTEIANVSFTGNKNATLMAGAVNLDLGDMITTVETQTGINSDRIIINKSVTIIGGQLWRVELLTSFSKDDAYWLLGTAGFSELGQTTTLGF